MADMDDAAYRFAALALDCPALPGRLSPEPPPPGATSEGATSGGAPADELDDIALLGNN